ncbi:MAG: hypothetical protein U1E29_05540 [Coriobacteriia bacterium]|nr:hypothetical protein [Coriobacteriia bacterium]
MSTPSVAAIAKALSAPSAARDHAPHVMAWTSLYRGARAAETMVLATGSYTRIPKGMKMGKRICEDWAGLLWAEGAEVAIGEEGGPESALAGEMFGADFAPLFSGAIERAFASSIAVADIIISDLAIRPDGTVGEGRAVMDIDFTGAGGVIPLAWTKRGITEVALVSYGIRHVDVREHRVIDGGRRIVNRRFDRGGDNGSGLTEMPPEALIGAGIAPSLDIAGAPDLFAVVQPACENNIETDSPYKVGIFANAVDHLAIVDTVFDNFHRDFHLGGKRVFVSDTLVKHDACGNPVPPSRDGADMYVMLEATMGVQGGMSDVFKEYNPELRVGDNTLALDAALSHLSSAVGMGSERYRYRGETVATATQIISENSDLFRNRRRHWLGISKAVETLARAALFIGANLCGMPVDPDAEIIVRSDDSVIEDDATKLARGLLLAQSGMISKARFQADYLGWTEGEIAAEATASPKVPSLFGAPDAVA